MTFGDDEQINSIQTGAAGFENEVPVGSTKVKIINVPNAQPEERILKVLVELTGKGKPIERSGLDLVIVLDISQHMNRQDKVKKATKLVIKKLSPVDRVSIVTFAQVANKLCALRQINKGSQKDILDLVNNVTCAADGANISDGLEMALEVLSGRKFTEDRSVGIILMSSGEQDGGRNAAEVKVGNVPVYTFGFGIGNKDNLTLPHVLDAIAKNSARGTYADVQNGDDLSVAFAQCFVGLMTVAVKDLKLVMSPKNMSTIENVYAGDHEQSRDDSAVSVMLGNLYDKETRKVLVHVLPPDTGVLGLQVLKVAYKYRNEVGKERKSTPLYASKKQIQNFTQEEIDDLMNEVIHLESAHMMNEGRTMAYINSPIGEGTVIPSSEVTTRGDVGNQKQEKLLHDDHTNSLCEDKDNVKKETTTLTSEVAARVEGAKLPVVSTLCMDTYGTQADSFANNRTKATDKDQEDLKEENIKPILQIATEGDVGEHPLSSTPYMDTDKKQEPFEKEKIHPLLIEEDNLSNATTPFFHVETEGEVGITPYMDLQKEQEEPVKDDKNTSPTNEGIMENESAPTSSEIASSGGMENSLLNSTQSTDEDNLNDKTVTPSYKVTPSSDTNQNQRELFSMYTPSYMENQLLSSTPCTDQEDLKEETIKPTLKVATEGDVGELPLSSTPYMDTDKKQEPFEKEKTRPLLRDEDNVKKETTPISSEVAESGDVKKPPSTLCTDKDDFREKPITPSLELATKGHVGELPLYTQHMDTHKKIVEPLPTNLENVKKEPTPPSSEVATNGDVAKPAIHSNPCTDEDDLSNATTPFFHDETEGEAGITPDLQQEQEEPFEKDDKNPSPTNERNMENESGPTSSEIASSGGMENSPLNSTQSTDEDNLNDKTVTPSSKVTVRSFMEKVLLFVTKLLWFFNLYTETHQKQGKSSEKDNNNSLPTENENVKEKTTPPSAKVVASDDEEKPLLFTSPGTNAEDLKKDIITPSSKVAARGYMQKLILLFTKLLVLLNLRNDMHQNQGELFEEDILYQLPKNEDAKKEITSTSPEVTASVDGETTPLFPPSCTDKDNKKEETITPFSKVADRGYMDIVFLFFPKLFLIFNLRNDTHKKQGELSELPTNKENVEGETTPPPSESAASGDVKKPPLFSNPCVDESVLKEEAITPSSKVPSGGFMEKLVLLFTKLLMIFNPRNRTPPKGESLEKDHTSSFPGNEENVKGKNTQPSSKVATSSDAQQNQEESPDKNHPNLLPKNEDNLKDRIITPPFQVAARGYMEKLVLSYTKVGESLGKDQTSSLYTNEENVNDEIIQPSSEIAITGDAQQKQAESYDKNHPNTGYIEKMLLFFTSRVDTNQRQPEPFQTDDTNSLSTDEHHEKERQYFISRVTRKIMESLTRMSNSVATQYTKIWMSIQELVATSFAYCYSPVLLVQDALRSPPSEFKTIMKVALLSVAAATVLYMVYVCFSYAKLRDLALPNIFYGFGLYNPFWLLDIVIIFMVVLLVCAYQVYYQPLFDFVDKHAARNFPNNEFLNKEYDISLANGFNSFKLNLFRLVWRTIFVIITTTILMFIPFFKVVVGIFGAFGFWPLTVYFLVEMYVVRKKIPEWSSRWISLQILSVAFLTIATAAGAGSFAAIVTQLKVFRPFQTSH